MKYIITEDQFEKVKNKILTVNFKLFNNDWDMLQQFLNRRGNPPYIIGDNIDLSFNQGITTLGNLISVEGDFTLEKTSVESLGNLTSVGGSFYLHKAKITSLDNLVSVGGNLNLRSSDIESLGNLSSVGRILNLIDTPISEKYGELEIRNMVEVGGEIYL